MTTGSESDVWTLGRLLDWSRTWLASKDLDEPRLSAELLLAHTMGCKKIELYTRFGEALDGEQLGRFRGLIRAAGTGTPIAYLLGKKEFYSLEFEVTAAVLIPRPETETLVSRALEIFRERGDAPLQFLDVGTGSGCIAVAICHYAANARGAATEISPEALAVASRNVARHGLEDRIRLVEASGLELPEETVPPGGFDLVVSNPPYVSRSVSEVLAENVRLHEPHVALYAGQDGMEFYRQFARGLGRILTDEGTVLVEIGAGSERAVGHEFDAEPGWVHQRTHRDASDPHPRVMEFRRRSG